MNLVAKLMAFSTVLIAVFALEFLFERKRSFENLSSRQVFPLRKLQALNFLMLAIFSLLIPLLRIYKDVSFKRFYSWFGVLELKPTFADMHYVTNSISCPGYYEIGQLIDCGERVFPLQYPSELIRLFFSPFDLRGLEEFLAISQNLFLCSLIALLISRGNFTTNLLIGIFLASPQFQLLMERGNLDILVISLTGFACIALNRSPNKIFLPFLLLILSSLLKFFTLPALICFLFIRCRERKYVLFVLVGFMISLYSLRSALLSARVGIDELKGVIGVVPLINFLKFEESSAISNLNKDFLGTVFIVLLVLFLSILGGLKVKLLSVNEASLGAGSIAISLTFVTLWVGASNYHYKLALLCLALIIISTDSIYLKRQSTEMIKVYLLLPIALLAFRETFFLISNLVIAFLVGTLISLALNSFRHQLRSRF
jgi:hypothetical protein